MKTISSLVVAAALWSPSLNAQVSLPAVTTGPVAIDAGPHHRTWQNVKIEFDERGKQVTTTNSYVEIATGMNVWSETEGKWVAANDQIELVNGGAVAARTQHKLTFLPNLNGSEPPIDLFLPDGRRLRSQVVGLAYTERDTGKSVFIGELKDSVGQVVGRNQVVYPDAFDSIKADVRYTVTQSFFEQDVILFENPGSPADYGLNPDTTLLEMYSEFFNPPAPTVQSASNNDQTLNFGQMQIGRGAAYLLDEESLKGIPVTKEWTTIDQRRRDF